MQSADRHAVAVAAVDDDDDDVRGKRPKNHFKWYYVDYNIFVFQSINHRKT